MPNLCGHAVLVAARRLSTLITDLLKAPSNVRFHVATIDKVSNGRRHGFAFGAESGIARDKGFTEDHKEFDFVPLSSRATWRRLEVATKLSHRLFAVGALERALRNFEIPV